MPGLERCRSGPGIGVCEGGGYLLFRFRSTIGVAGVNFSVRNGKRWNPRAITTLVLLSVRCEAAACALSALLCLPALLLYRVEKRESGSCVILCRTKCPASSLSQCLFLSLCLCFLPLRPLSVGEAVFPERVWVISIARL